jgi:hypothetical protein
MAMYGRWTIAIMFLAIGLVAYAQTQGMKDFGDRLEGTNVHRNALEDFTLVAVHRNFPPFVRNVNLNVRFFLPKLPGNPPKKVLVQAAELQDSFHYFMQTKDPTWKDGSWNIFAHWPTRDVIDQLGVQAENLGVLAQYRVDNQRPVYLPVDVYQSDGQTPRRAYTFQFITGQDLQSLELSVTNIAGTEVNLNKPTLKCNKSFNPNCKLYAAGSTQAFDLDMSSLVEGEYHLKLIGHVPGTSTPTSLEIALYHHPQAK